MYYRCSGYTESDHPMVRVTEEVRAQVRKRQESLQGQLTQVRKRKQTLVEGRLDGEFDSETDAAMSRELRERETRVVEDLEALGLQESEDADLAVEVFELSQDLQRQWVAADEAAKRRILQILGLNWTLEEKTLVPELRKPFDVLARGLVGAGERSGEP